MAAGLEDGVVDIFQATSQDYDDIACVKIHTDKVTGIYYDVKNNVVYSVSEDRTLRVSHGGSLALVTSIPHKQPLMSMLKDEKNERLFFGSNNGEVYISDISHAEKPKLQTTLNNNYQG